jgi:hypothetical protein
MDQQPQAAVRRNEEHDGRQCLGEEGGKGESRDGGV